MMTGRTPPEDHDGLTRWTSPCLPLRVRRPWQIYHERLEDDADCEADPARRAALRFALRNIQRLGGPAGFASLSPCEQRPYHDVAVIELGAHLNFQTGAPSPARLSCDAAAEAPDDPDPGSRGPVGPPRDPSIPSLATGGPAPLPA